MRNHSENGGRKGIIWMMIPCLFLVAVIFFGGDTSASSGYLWLMIVGICVIPHIWMMFRGHGGSADPHTEKKTDVEPEKQPDTKSEHKHDSCCH